MRGLKIKVAPLHDDYEEYGEEIPFAWMTFLAVSSYGKASMGPYANGTIFVSDGYEYFTQTSADKFEKLLSETIFRNTLADLLISPKLNN